MSSGMRGRASEQDGWALITAVMVMAIMLGFGLATFAFVDTEQKHSGVERVRESSFNLAEGAMSQQVFILSRGWPGIAANAYPACSSAATLTKCPDPGKVGASFSESDFASGTSWTTQVRDNGGSAINYYNDAITSAQPAWDANGDGRLWVRSQAVVRGRKRTLGALVKIQVVNEVFPKNVVTAGKFATTNNGNKVIVNTKGPSAQAAPLAVRCTGNPPSSCLNYQPSKGQVSPDTRLTGYASTPAITPDALERFRATAQANGTYYASGCPANPSGGVVFIESGTCSWNNSAGTCCNSATSPGVLIVNSGSVSFNGNIVFYGIVYAANAQGSSADLVSVGGTASIQGSVAVDGAGGIAAGSSQVNLVYDDRAFAAAKSYGTAGIVQNTWREIQG